MSKIEQIRQLLEAEQRRLDALVERTGKHLYRRDEPYPADFAEQAVEVENNQVVEQLDENGKHRLAEIRSALARIEKGCFGICESCGEEIKQSRLEIIPHTRFCIDCAEFHN
ncbi:MAG: TraR/DksA family transcriptional regulator [Pseudomonadales bacterium]|nr:TraR/DksA family transcriptional regulator [Pseudomonadales bacterium]